MAMARLSAELAICHAVFSSRSPIIYWVKTGMKAELSAPPATILKIKSGTRNACKNASEVVVVPNTNANIEVRSRPRMRLAMKAPCKISAALPMRTFCIMPVSWAGTAVGCAWFISTGGPDGLRCNSGNGRGGRMRDGDTSVGGIGIDGDICAATGISGFLGDICGGRADGEDMPLVGDLDIFR